METPNLTALPPGIRSRFVDGVNGLRVHLLEAGFEAPARPLVLLLHGFPEIAYSWRKVMLALAAAGFRVVAPDQRGFGLTTGWDRRYDGDVDSFRTINLVRDALGLVAALGHREIAAAVGHDAGAAVAGCCGLLRPDIAGSVVMMSSPFAGPPPLPFGTADGTAEAPAADVHAGLATLDPPRKHYQWYYSTRSADGDMRNCPQGIHDFLRAYFHHKSADWPDNAPYRLGGWTAEELAKLPTYYVMPKDATMPEAVAPFMPPPERIAACGWLPEEELRVYSDSYAATGFQGGLQWYRCRTEPGRNADLQIFAGRTIDVPSMFVAGRADWGTYQFPGAVERMQHEACTRMLGCHLVDGAGHWVQQERPDEVAGLLLGFLREVRD